MAPLVKAFAGVDWLWILGTGAVLSCVFLAIRLPFKKRQDLSLLTDLGGTLFVGFAFTVLLVLIHASPGAIEVVYAIFFAYVMEALLCQMLRIYMTNKSGKVSAG